MAVGASLALVGVFAAIAMGVVSSRRPLDREMTRSFNSVAKKVDAIVWKATPLGCRKTRVSYYACSIEQTPRHGRGGSTYTYTIMLRDDGCWSAVSLQDADDFRPLSGCFASSG